MRPPISSPEVTDERKKMFELRNLEIASFPTMTRMPFRYGIAELTAMPHIFMRATVTTGGSSVVHGVSADGLLPRWFEKDPGASFQRDLDRLWEVIRHAGSLALGYGDFDQPFHFWRDLYDEQFAWGEANGYPPLLAHYGLSLVERCVLDAVCRSYGKPLATLLANGTITVDGGRVADAPSAPALQDVIRAAPLDHVHARHTVGMADPLTRADVREPLDDGLPESLEEDIEYYGLTHFKIKVQGDVAGDIERLEAIRSIVTAKSRPDFRFTLDGNEQFEDVDTFRAFWEGIRSSTDLTDFFSHLIFIEQPFKRDIALSEEVGQALTTWHDAPPVIIDESDGSLGTLPLALARGFCGTSHKNCKGVFKGIINRARIAERQAAHPDGGYVMSAEDLVNIGPVALLQDLAIVAKLGISHVERNGHHYCRGLSMFPQDIQERVLQTHPDLYRPHRDGYPELRVENGIVSTESINAAPFGVGFVPEADYVPLADWKTPKAPDA